MTIETIRAGNATIVRRHGRIIEFTTCKGIKRVRDDIDFNELFDSMLHGSGAQVDTVHEAGTDDTHRKMLREPINL